jgi:hypothetical protein
MRFRRFRRLTVESASHNQVLSLLRYMLRVEVSSPIRIKRRTTRQAVCEVTGTLSRLGVVENIHQQSD